MANKKRIGIKGGDTVRAIMSAIEEEREKQNLTIAQLGVASGCSPNTYKSAKRERNTTVTTLAAFCAALDIEIVLVDREGRALT